VKIVIGMVGKAGAGKDTTADWLCRRYEFSKVAFADPLKKSVKELFMLSDLEAFDRVEREKVLSDFDPWSPRKLYQFVGTELLRNQFDENIWVKLLNKKIHMMNSNRIVISDCRFPNEEKYIRELGDKDGYKTAIIEVVRTGHNGNVGLKGHASESHVLNSDYKIENTGSLEDLYHKVDEIMNALG